MGHLRDVKKLMQESKLRKAKEKARERELHKQERLQQYQELCRQADILIKKAQEEENRKRMEQLQALAEKAPQKASEEPQMAELHSYAIRPYFKGRVERFPVADNLWQTRKELQQAEQNDETEGGRINWEEWDKVVRNTIEQLGNIEFKQVERERQKRDYTPKHIYIYDRQLNLIGEYDSIYKAAQRFGMFNSSIRHLMQTGMPHKKLGITVLQHKLSL